MAQRFNRVAAGVCAVVAIAVAGGAGAAVTSADPGGPRSPSDHSRDGAHSVRHGDGRPGQGHRQRDDGRHGETSVKDRDASDGRGAHRRPDRTALRAPRGDDAPSVLAGRGTSTALLPLAPAAIASRPAAEPARPSALPDKPATSVGKGGGGGGGGGGSTAQAPAARVVPKAPKVPEMIVGDGRSPAFVPAGPEATPARVEPEPVAVRAPAPVPAPAPPAPAPVSSPAPPAAQPHDWSLPVMPVTSSLRGKVEPAWPAGVLFGLAGLVLAPIAGMWLGLRQARASNSADLLTAS